MKFVWSPQARWSFHSINPQSVGEQIEKIRGKQRGIILPEDLVEDAESIDSPLHKCFEWDDRKAAHASRIRQAGYILRHLVVASTNQELEQRSIRAYVVIQRGKPEEAYTSFSEAFSDPILRREILRGALQEVQMWERRYKELQELAIIFEAIHQTQRGKD